MPDVAQSIQTLAETAVMDEPGVVPEEDGQRRLPLHSNEQMNRGTIMEAE